MEDDKTLSNGICLTLENENITLSQAYTIASATLALTKESFNLIILDINLPDGNGLDFLKKIKSKYQIPVIMLTANDLETDIVIGLEMGADDYITKPFSLAILRARVNAQLRKKENNQEQKVILDDFIFDFNLMVFSKNSFAVELSKTEQKLLKLLIHNKGITLKRESLMDKIWIDGSDFVDENALSVAIKRLRNKLESDPSKPIYIKTVYGIGYTWVVK